MDEMNSCVRVLSAYPLHMLSKQGLANYHLVAGDTWRNGVLKFVDFSMGLLDRYFIGAFKLS